VAATGRQIGFIFPVGNMQGYFNLKGYWEFAARKPARRLECLGDIFALATGCAATCACQANDHEVSVRAIRLNAPI
jgi:hypothetical protein